MPDDSAPTFEKVRGQPIILTSDRSCHRLGLAVWIAEYAVQLRHPNVPETTEDLWQAEIGRWPFSSVGFMRDGSGEVRNILHLPIPAHLRLDLNR